MEPTENTVRGVLNPRAGEGVYAEDLLPPGPDLVDIVEHHWGVRWDLREREPFTVEVLPRPAIQFVVEEGRARVHGVLRGRFDRTMDGRGDIFGVSFRPAGFRPLLRGPAADLTDRVIDAVELFGPAAAELAGQIAATDDRGERAAHAEAFCRHRIRMPVAPSVRLVNSIVDATTHDRKILRVDHLVERFGVGKRTLQKLFREYVGVTPKWVVQRCRLHEAAQRLDSGAADLAGLAHELGYADQAHFARDFRAVVGRAPAGYARQSGRPAPQA
ncbi:helix-turn-helix domain-containing protein [Nocardioides speluncae]|uniref:helix-turn-helix domain-containing protein n=1 Tax=Nocardioides speluncae TaxID=2670337 RepID=UPI00197FE651|nr:helix-turn-helix domain-containing protein [Nocardioides speluncae]